MPGFEDLLLGGAESNLPLDANGNPIRRRTPAPQNIMQQLAGPGAPLPMGGGDPVAQRQGQAIATPLVGPPAPVAAAAPAAAASEAASPAATGPAPIGPAAGGIMSLASQAVPPVPPGPVVNNAGTTSNAGGVTGFEPMRGGPVTLDDRGLAALGYASNADNSLRRTGTPYDQQLNLMTQLQRLSEASAPGINALDSATRDQQAAAHSQYMAANMQNLMQHFGSQIMPNQLGQQQFGLQSDIARGVNGIPGSIANAASDAENRTRENDRWGPNARYDAFYTQRMAEFPPGTPYAARVRQLQQDGLSPPEFITGRGRDGATGGPRAQGGQGGGAGGGAGGVPRPVPPNNDLANTVDTAFETGLSSFPMGPTGVRQIPQGDMGALSPAITQIFAGLPDAALQDPQVRQRLVSQFGTGALDNWLNSSNTLMNRLSGAGNRQQEQIQRYLRLAGMQQQPITPANAGANPFSRTISAGPFGVMNSLFGQ